MKDIVQDIKSVLEFYKALGFERLPINLVKGSGGQGVKGAGDLARTLESSNHQTLNKDAALEGLRSKIGDCQRCKLSKGRTNIVFGEGNVDAEIMFIGEGPGREEDIQARPFVGEAGQLLTKLIEKMGFKRKDVYIANIVKCRPPMNRDPEDDEIQACMPFVKRQTEIISPKTIISLGRVSAQALTGTKIPISKLRGRFFDYSGIPLMPTFHPAYLLRNPKDKRLVWEDVQKVLQRLKE